MTDRLTMTQKRMRFLYREFKDISGGKELSQKLKGLPVALRTNGLAVILAQLTAASDRNEKFTGAILARWLLNEHPLDDHTANREKNSQSMTDIKALLVHCLEADRIEYEALQHESMALVEQAKLIAEALWPGED